MKPHSRASKGKYIGDREGSGGHRDREVPEQHESSSPDVPVSSLELCTPLKLRD